MTYFCFIYDNVTDFMLSKEIIMPDILVDFLNIFYPLANHSLYFRVYKLSMVNMVATDCQLGNHLLVLGHILINHLCKGHNQKGDVKNVFCPCKDNLPKRGVFHVL